MPVKSLAVLDAHPDPRPASGTYNLYVLSTDDHYYLQSDTEEIDLSEAGLDFVTDTNEPTGHIDNTDSTISFVNGTRTFTIQPAVTSFSYYESGTKYTKTTAQNVVIADTEGTHYIYFDGATLTVVANPTSSQIEIIYKIKTLCTIIYWDGVNDEQILLGEERHGCVMDGETHYFLHAIMGTQYRSGAALNSLVTEGNGSSNTHAQFGVDAGVIADEDLVITLAAVTSTTGLPVYYKLGAAGYWRRDFNSGFSIITAGTGRAAYNEWTGSTWQKTEITNTKFACLHVFAVNDITYPYIVVMGQEEYSTKVGAQAGAQVEIDTLVTSGMPFVEFKPIATVLIQTSDSYGNDVQTRTREVESGVDYVDWRASEFSSAGSVTSVHNNLSGLQGGQGGEYYHLTVAQYAALEALSTSSVQGLRASWVSNSTLRIAVGKCRSDDDTTNLINPGNEDAVLSSSGAGGLDTGSESSSTPYYLWLIYNPTTDDYAAMLSLSATSPTMPSGYTKKRLVGFSFNNSSSNLHDFTMTGDGRVRYVQYNEHRQNECQLLSAGTAGSWANVDCSDLIPENACSAIFLMQSYGEGYLRPDGFSGSSTGIIYCPETCTAELLMTSTQIIEYEVDAGSMQLDLVGYRVLI